MKKFRFNKSLIFAIILITICHYPIIVAQDSPQKTHISILAKNRPLREVLQEISAKTNTKFVFNDNLVDGKTVSCQIINLPIEKAIRQIMNQADISFEILPIELIVLFKNTSDIDTKTQSRLTTTDFTPVRFTPPTLQVNVEPDYPHEARREGLEGSVEMKLLVSEKGEVKQAIVHKSSGYEILDNAAIEFAKRLKYNPAKKQGKPLDVWVSRVMHYQLVEKLFLPAEYVEKIKNLTLLADRSVGSDRERVLREILNYH